VRQVRLCCVFLSSLVRQRAGAVVELLVELQAFCLEFSAVKEAAALFQLLRSVEAEGAGDEGG
jgi:hypothetical protein